MMKGHVKIELLDHRTGRRKITERDNMLTNSLAYRAGIDSNDNLGLYASEYSIMPLGTKGLGGLLLFACKQTHDQTRQLGDGAGPLGLGCLRNRCGSFLYGGKGHGVGGEGHGLEVVLLHSGEGHGIKNAGDKDLHFIALVVLD